MNIASFMCRAGHTFPEAAALAVGERVVFDYAMLSRRVACLAAGMRNEHGLRPCDRVGILAKDCAEYIEILYACCHAGLIVVPINAKLHPNEVRFIAENSGMALCFATIGLGGAEASEAVRWIAIGGDEYQRLIKSPAIALKSGTLMTARGYSTPAVPPAGPRARPLRIAIC